MDTFLPGGMFNFAGQTANEQEHVRNLLKIIRRTMSYKGHNMKIKLILKFLIILLLSIIMQPTWAHRLKGRVKSYTDCYYSIRENFGRIKKGSRLADTILHNQQVFFDEKGNVSQATDFHEDGTMDCIYDAKSGYEDNIIESFHVRLNMETSMEKMPFILESANFNYGGLCRMTYKNDIYGRPVEETIYDLLGKVLLKTTIKRDSVGNALEEKYSDGTVNRNTYDRDGNIIECYSSKPDGNIVVTTFRHNEHGDIIEKNVNNFFNSRYKFVYENYTYEYKYDKMGNWIERTEYENLIPQRILVRTIEYHNELSLLKHKSNF